MFETLKRLYSEGELTLQGLENAIIKGWITEKQKQEIIEGSDT